MTGIMESFADSPRYNVFGVVTGTATDTQFPTGTCVMVRFKADPDNVGVFKLGDWVENVGLFPISAGDDTGWAAAHDLNQFVYSNNSGTSDLLFYWLQK